MKLSDSFVLREYVWKINLTLPRKPSNTLLERIYLSFFVLFSKMIINVESSDIVNSRKGDYQASPQLNIKIMIS